MPKLQDFAAAMIQQEAQTLERLMRCTPKDKAAWMPLEKGRSAIEQIVECGGFGFFGSRTLADRKFPEFDIAIMKKNQEEIDTVDKAITFLKSGTEAFIGAVLAFPDEELDKRIDFPFQPGTTKSFTEVIMMVYWNMVYHEGQINYIQTLYGDKEIH